MAIIDAANSATTLGIRTNTVVGSSSTTTPVQNAPKIKNVKKANILHDYSSFNYSFSLSVLDMVSLRTANYKKTPVRGPFLARSASSDPANRVKTASGKFEFFIEDVRFSHIVAFTPSTGNTNAFGISFKIIEPYSMGLFFQAIQTDAMAKGYNNYTLAPLLLTIKFMGHKSPEEQMQSIDAAVKHIPLRIRIADMKVTGRGTEYDISAIPINEQAFEDSNSRLTSATSVVGTTVGEMLSYGPSSLMAALNTRLRSKTLNKTTNKSDEIVILFPSTDPQEDMNDIGKSSMGFSLIRPGDTPFASDNFVYDDKTHTFNRGNLSINPTESEFRFAQGSDVVNAINQVILMSDYGRTALSKINSDGSIRWWRIETGIEYVDSDDNMKRTGTCPLRLVYRVIPYDVDSSFFLPPNSKRVGTELDKQQVIKEYNYIYTGKNLDILNFDISFKNGFYAAVMADGGKRSGDKIIATKMSIDGQKDISANDKNSSFIKDGSSVVNDKETPTRVAPSKLETSTSKQGGGGLESDATRAARQFHDAITRGVDMVVLDMTIMGDPYFIGDSGLGNYHALPGNDSKYENADGSMAWDTGEVHVIVNFKTPVDIDIETGMYDFGNTITATQFSGLYKVNIVESQFSRGKFTQTLKLMRLPNQESETETKTILINSATEVVEPPTPTQPDTTVSPASVVRVDSAITPPAGSWELGYSVEGTGSIIGSSVNSYSTLR